MKRHTQLTLIALAALAALAGLPPAAGAADGQKTTAVSTASQPWRDATQSPEVRAKQLLTAMTQEQKVVLISAVDPVDYAPLAALGIPAMTRVDASCGLRGDRGVTAFPVPIQLAATFNTSLAADYGRAIAVEARAKGWNIILGPTVDIARDPRNGRVAEGFGEDPLLTSHMGVAFTNAVQKQHLIVQAKHFTIYQTERDRGKMNINVSQRALQEVYNVPFHYLVEQANVTSLMVSYPKVNGVYAMENKPLLDMVKIGENFKGYLGTDFLGGEDGVAQINAGIDSWALQPNLRKPDALRDGRVSKARIDDAAYRTLWALFTSGVFDDPVTTVPAATVTTAEHQAIALRTATEGTVLLKNEGAILPLQRKGKLAVIGPADRDVVTGVMWSSWVEPGPFTTPIDAISDVAGRNVKVIHSQGSAGDVTLPTMGAGDVFGPQADLLAPDGSKGWGLEVFGNADLKGPPIHKFSVKSVDASGKPAANVPDQWSARWTAKLTPGEDGLTRLAATISGTVKVTVDGKVVMDGMRSTATNFPGGGPLSYPLQALVQLTKGKPVDITVEYSMTGANIGQRMQLGWQPTSLIPAAVKAAREADTAVVFVNHATGEEMDRDDYALPGDQDALIEAVAAANPSTVVVLNTSGPVKMPWLSKVKGVVQMWLPGAAAGRGIAQVLYGDAEPGGRLPVTFPVDDTQGPVQYKGGMTFDYKEGIFVGHSWYEKYGKKPLFPFGHGLSYTTFNVGELKVRPLAVGEKKTEVAVRVSNTGKRTGSTVVQVYSGSLPTREETASRLLGYAKVELKPGEERTVSIPVERRTLSIWDEARKVWSTPTGLVPVRVGFSAEETPLKAALHVR